MEARSSFAVEDFTLAQILELGSHAREMGQDAQNMEDASSRIVRHLYQLARPISIIPSPAGSA